MAIYEVEGILKVETRKSRLFYSHFPAQTKKRKIFNLPLSLRQQRIAAFSFN
jgi:hypothetical protein